MRRLIVTACNRGAATGLARLAVVASLATGGALAVAQPSDPAAVVRLLARQDAAVLRVGERLAVANAGLCGDSARSAGFSVHQLSQYGAVYRPAARAILRISERPTVALTVPGGAADSAGVRPGDVIVAIDGHAFAESAPTRNAGEFAGIATAHDVIDAALADGRAELSLLRDGRPLALTVMPRAACRARFDVRAGRRNNASADGTYIQVSSDLVAQAQDDGQLAAILAHELAHNILDHPRQRRAKGPRPSVRSTEIAADRLSVYLLDAAGYGVADAVAFWGTWGRANDLGILSDRSHPGWQKRIALIETEARLIAATKAAARPVVPPVDLLPPRR